VLTFIFLAELLGGFVTFREGRAVEVEDSSREVWIGFFLQIFVLQSLALWTPPTGRYVFVMASWTTTRSRAINRSKDE
jgi:hypothetical protein